MQRKKREKSDIPVEALLDRMVPPPSTNGDEVSAGETPQDQVIPPPAEILQGVDVNQAVQAIQKDREDRVRGFSEWLAVGKQKFRCELGTHQEVVNGQPGPVRIVAVPQ